MLIEFPEPEDKSSCCFFCPTNNKLYLFHNHINHKCHIWETGSSKCLKFHWKKRIQSSSDWNFLSINFLLINKLISDESFQLHVCLLWHRHTAVRYSSSNPISSPAPCLLWMNKLWSLSRVHVIQPVVYGLKLVCWWRNVGSQNIQNKLQLNFTLI